ncbi:hypothetical protein D3C81_1445440 [compost metagenome]
MLRGDEQRRQISRVAVGVSAELIEAGAQFALCLQQQGLRVARQFAGSEQVGLAEFIKARQARAQGVGQRWRQFAEFFLQIVDGLTGTAQAQGVAAGEVILDVACHLVLKLLRQTEIALHQQVRALKGFLRPPQRRAECETHGDQQQGIEIGEQLQAHDGYQRQKW